MSVLHSTSATHTVKPRRRVRTWLAACAVIGLSIGLAGAGFALIPPAPYSPLAGLDSSRVSLIALGDQGSGTLQQWTVARAMERVADKDGRLDMVTLLGDNFYGKSLTGTRDISWQMKFERVYSGDWLSHVPFYAVLGNHDYPTSQQVELDYSQQKKGSGRWQMPDRQYTKDFGTVEGRPLVRMVFLNTSAPAAELHQQIAFLEQAFEQPGPAPIWRIVAAHHPVRNSGKHEEESNMMTDLLPALQRAKVDVYLAGHDHNQQLMLDPGEPAWVISGGGGQKLYPVDEGQPDTVFAASRAGFAKLDFSGDQLKLAYYDEQGGAATHFTWARGCPWMAKGCLIADNRQ